MTSSIERAVTTAANDTSGTDRVAVALRGLTVLPARAHVREIAAREPVNRTSAPDRHLWAE
jgi:hypothetical protein